MSAYGAFEKLERRGWGLWPIFLVSILTIAVTIGAILAISRVRRDAAWVQLESLFVAAEVLGKTSTIWQELVPLEFDGSPGFVEESAKSKHAIENALKQDAEFLGAFTTPKGSLTELFWKLLEDRALLTLERHGAIEISDKQSEFLLMRSVDGERLIITASGPLPDLLEGNADARSIKVDLSKIDLIEGLAKLRDAHRQRLTESSAVFETGDLLQWINDDARKVWVNAVANPDPFHDQLKLASKGSNANDKYDELAHRSFTVGYKTGICPATDEVAIRTFREQMTDEAAEAKNDSELIVIHPSTTTIHLARKLNIESQEKSHSSLLEKLLASSEPLEVTSESYLQEQTKNRELKLLGKIQNPFAATIYRLVPN